MTEHDPSAASQEAPIGRLEARCACGELMDDDCAERCPACGAPRLLRLDFPVFDLYSRAQAALGSAGLIRREASAHGTFGAAGTLYAGTAGGVLWIDAARGAEAADILQRIDVFVGGASGPIVDRSETSCPQCGAALDGRGEPRCAACGLRFQWIDINEPAIDPTGRRCHACGYELTGLTSGRCPECGSPIEADARDLETMIASATGESAPVSARPPVKATGLPPALARRLEIVGLAYLGGGSAAAVVLQHAIWQLSVVAALVAVAGMAILLYRWSRGVQS